MVGCCQVLLIMKTIVSNIEENDDYNKIIKDAGEIIRKGGLVAFPTETVYGLGGDGLNPEASKKIYAAKGRPSDNPLILHICDIKQLEDIAETDDVRIKKLAEKFWPGPLTMVLKKKDIVPKSTTGGLETVAVRMPNNKVALDLIRAANTPIAAPSANTSGRPSPTNGKRVAEDLDGKIDMILDAGSVEIGLESSIIDLTGEKACILRPGAVTKEMFEEVLGEIDVDRVVKDPSSVKEGYKPKAPGMKYRHYAPKAELKMFRGEEKKVANEINKLAAEDEKCGLKVGIIASLETAKLYDFGEVVVIGPRNNDVEIARNLYEILREFDDKKADRIYSEVFEDGKLAKAIMNRFSKAASNNIIDIL